MIHRTLQCNISNQTNYITHLVTVSRWLYLKCALQYQTDTLRKKNEYSFKKVYILTTLNISNLPFGKVLTSNEGFNFIAQSYLQLQQREAILFGEYLRYRLSHPTCKLPLQAQALGLKDRIFPLAVQQCRLHPKEHQDGQDTKNLDCCKCI